MPCAGLRAQDCRFASVMFSRAAMDRGTPRLLVRIFSRWAKGIGPGRGRLFCDIDILARVSSVCRRPVQSARRNSLVSSECPAHRFLASAIFASVSGECLRLFPAIDLRNRVSGPKLLTPSPPSVRFTSGPVPRSRRPISAIMMRSISNACGSSRPSRIITTGRSPSLRRIPRRTLLCDFVTDSFARPPDPLPT